MKFIVSFIGVVLCCEVIALSPKLWSGKSDQELKCQPAKYSQAGQDVDLQMGNLFLAPDKNLNVCSKPFKLSVAKNSIVIVEKSWDHFAVFNFYGSAYGSVAVFANGEKLTIPQGTVSCLSDANSDSCEQVKELKDSKFSCRVLAGGQKYYTASFSEAKFLKYFYGLGNLVQDKSLEERQAIEKHLHEAVSAQQNNKLN